MNVDWSVEGMKNGVYWFSCVIIGIIIGYEILSLWEFVNYHLFKSLTQGVVTIVMTTFIVMLFYWIWRKFIVDKNTRLIGYITTISTIVLFCANYMLILAILTY